MILYMVFECPKNQGKPKLNCRTKLNLILKSNELFELILNGTVFFFFFAKERYS